MAKADFPRSTAGGFAIEMRNGSVYTDVKSFHLNDAAVAEPRTVMYGGLAADIIVAITPSTVIVAVIVSNIASLGWTIRSDSGQRVVFPAAEAVEIVKSDGLFSDLALLNSFVEEVRNGVT